MLVQRKELPLRIGLFAIGVAMHRIQLQWVEMMIANALTPSAIWTQSGPQLPMADWEGRQRFATRADEAKFFAATALQVRLKEQGIECGFAGEPLEA